MSEKELHTHGTDCACGHNHHHHDDGCGCGHDHAHEDIDKKAFLRKLVPGLFFFLLGAAVEHLIPGSESSTCLVVYFCGLLHLARGGGGCAGQEHF